MMSTAYAGTAARRFGGLQTTNATAPKSVRASSGDFHLPSELEASSPPEARGIARDEVRMMVSYISTDTVQHMTFRSLPDVLEPADVVVINTSATLRAAIDAVRESGDAIELHLSTRLPDGAWLVELRQPANDATLPLLDGRAGETLRLAEGARVILLEPRTRDASQPARLWRAELFIDSDIEEFLSRNGRPIRYAYVKREWPIEYYQNVYANEPGSAEMPSAGRPFTAELITQLVARGIVVVPIVLHTGVASLEKHEPPFEEYYRVSASTAGIVNESRRQGHRVVAVGTTVVRALESSIDARGTVRASEGWTDLVITPERRVRSVDAILTGMHEPSATHLAMLEAIAGSSHVRLAYQEAVRLRYLWHEFGDVHLILP